MTRREALDTETMLQRLTTLLTEHEPPQGIVVGYDFGRTRADAEQLRRISMTLHRWHELECNFDIVRGYKNKDGSIREDEVGTTWMRGDRNDHAGRIYYRHIPDREKGALARLAKVMARYPALKSYVQGDPRGCALYIIRPGDVPEGEDVSAYYSRGVAVHQ